MHALQAPGADGEDTDAQFKLLSLARQYLMEGGPERIGYTLPPLVFATLRLVQRVRKVWTDRDGWGKGEEGEALLFVHPVLLM